MGGGAHVSLERKLVFAGLHEAVAHLERVGAGRRSSTRGA
jgi:hypothetical protein